MMFPLSREVYVVGGNAAVTKILLNGRDAGAVDQIGDFVDRKELLKTGKNMLEIHLATTLSNAVNNNSRAVYGISDAQLVPYIEVALGSGSNREKEIETPSMRINPA